jgi:acylphosphatase
VAETAAFSAKVRGKVQGVGFRYSAVREARRLRLNGWVKNSEDGNVEVWAEGPQDKLDLYLKWLHRGPEYSRVHSVKMEDETPKGYVDFIVMY